jgi:hypothetical protein
VILTSKHRVENSKLEKSTYELFDDFTKNLNIIRTTLENDEKTKSKIKETDNNFFEDKYHYYATNKTDICPVKNKLMDSLYKQGSSLITHQTNGHWVNWDSFINLAKDKYLSVLSEKWAEFFTQVDKIKNISNETTQLADLYSKFYKSTLENEVQDPIKYFHLFVDYLVEVSSFYEFCSQKQISSNDNTYMDQTKDFVIDTIGNRDVSY